MESQCVLLKMPHEHRRKGYGLDVYASTYVGLYNIILRCIVQTGNYDMIDRTLGIQNASMQSARSKQEMFVKH